MRKQLFGYGGYAIAGNGISKYIGTYHEGLIKAVDGNQFFKFLNELCVEFLN